MTLDEVISYNRLFADMETKSGNLEVAEYYRDTAKCLEELKELREQISEYKRLLKLAVEDFETIESNLEYDEHCVIKTHRIRCDECPLSADTIYRCKWRYADEALALIGKDIDVPATEGDTNVGRKKEGEQNG